MKNQKVIVLFAIALLLAVVVGGVQTVAAVTNVTASAYKDNITQPIDVGKIRFVGNVVDGEWVKGTKFAGQPMEIMYWQKATKHLIDIYVNDSGYITGNVSFHRWGYGVPNITEALANQSLAKLPRTTPELITEAVYKDRINGNISAPINTSKIQYVGNARHKEWVIGSKIAHGNTLIYWDKYTKWVITLKLDSDGKVIFVDFGLNGNRAVKVIPPSLSDETISKLFP